MTCPVGTARGAVVALGGILNVPPCPMNFLGHRLTFMAAVTI